MIATPPVVPALIRKANRKTAIQKLTDPAYVPPPRKKRGRVPYAPRPKIYANYVNLVREQRTLIESMRNNGMSWPEVAAALGVPEAFHNRVRNAANRAKIGTWDREAVRRFVKGHLPYIRKQRELGASWATIGRDLGLVMETLRLAAVEADPKLLTRPSKYVVFPRNHHKDGERRSMPPEAQPGATNGQGAQIQ
jgi:hypothetical protein